MKKLIIILSLTFLLASTIWSQPIHHRILDWAEDNHIVNRWTLLHFGQGLVYSWSRSSETVHYKLYEKWGWEYPSSWRILGENLAIALVWEFGEFILEGHLDWQYYDEIYGGYAFKDNAYDVMWSMLGCIIPIADGIWWDIRKIGKSNYRVNLIWSL